MHAMAYMCRPEGNLGMSEQTQNIRLGGQLRHLVSRLVLLGRTDEPMNCITYFSAKSNRMKVASSL